MADGRVTLKDDPQTFELAKLFWEKKRICMYCGVKFNLLDSFGKWDCKIHTGSKEISYPTDKKRGRMIYPYGKIQMSCCKQTVYPEQVISRTLSELQVHRHPVKRFKNRTGESTTLWSGNSSRVGRINNYQEAQIVREFIPEGCYRCDHRDSSDKWIVPTRNDVGDTFTYQGGSISNIQDFAPILAIMDKVEDREAFKKIDNSGNVSRIEVNIK